MAIFATKDTTCNCVKSFATPCSHDVANFRNYAIDSDDLKIILKKILGGISNGSKNSFKAYGCS